MFANRPASTMESRGNPALLQQGDPSRTPLFLIHDSSGGVFNYFKLEPLGRPVYTIYNPWLRNTEKWNGGTMLFVEKYIELIKTIVRRGNILVGGARTLISKSESTAKLPLS